MRERNFFNPNNNNTNDPERYVIDMLAIAQVTPITPELMLELLRDACAELGLSPHQTNLIINNVIEIWRARGVNTTLRGQQ